jgi:hypothetical protein
MPTRALRSSTTGEGMDASSPDTWQRRAGTLSVLAGGALGAVGLGGGGLLVGPASHLLLATAGVLTTVLASLAAGLWGGSEPASDSEATAVRWRIAGLVVGVCGAVAVAWERAPFLHGLPMARTAAMLLLLAVPIYAIAFLLPGILAWAEGMEAGDEEEERADEPAEGWGALGVVIPGVLVGMLAGVMVSMLLAAVGLRAGTLFLFVAVILFIPTFSRARSEPVRRWLVHERDTPFGVVRVEEIVYPARRQPERRLFLDDEEESGELVRSGAPTLAYVAAAERWLKDVAEPGDRYLFLGGGAYTLPRRIAEHDPLARITVVERDREMTRIAERFFALRRAHDIRSVYGDGRAVLDEGLGERYERICVDVYGGSESLPYGLVTREAMERLRDHLAEEGTLAINAIGVGSGPGATRFWSLVRTVADVFPRVEVYHHLGTDFPDRQNFLVVAALDEGAELPQGAGSFDRWPLHAWPQLDGALVFRDRYRAPSPAAAPESES